MDSAEIKQRVGQKSVDELVQSGMKIGLGTGSTAIHAVRRIGELAGRGKLTGLLVVATSFQAEVEARSLGLSLRSLNDSEIDGRLDLTIDGADEVDPDWNLIKGGGAAMLIEKIVAAASKDYAIVVDGSKIGPRLGSIAPVPVELVPMALNPVRRALERYGRVVLRLAEKKDGPVVTDHGNFVLDLEVKAAFKPTELEREIMQIPGVMANGIFTRQVTDLFIGNDDGTVAHQRHSDK